MDKQITLSETVVKYLFSGVDCEVAIGEDGYVVYGFEALYPSKLGVFVPSEVDRSNYCLLFPKSFEAYFTDLDDDLSYLSRLLEADIRSNFFGHGIEYIPGMVLKRDHENYTIFRFDKLMDSSLKTDLLCRADVSTLDAIPKIARTKPYFLAEATTLDRRTYLYFVLPIDELFMIDGKVIAATFDFLQSLRKKQF